MMYRVKRGCPKCGNQRIRQITRERYERLTGTYPKGVPYICPDADTFGEEHAGCGHVWESVIASPERGARHTTKRKEASMRPAAARHSMTNGATRKHTDSSPEHATSNKEDTCG